MEHDPRKAQLIKTLDIEGVTLTELSVAQILTSSGLQLNWERFGGSKYTWSCGGESGEMLYFTDDARVGISCGETVEWTDVGSSLEIAVLSFLGRLYS